MVRAAIRLCVALACVGLGWSLGASAPARAQEHGTQEHGAESAITAIAAGGGALYVIRNGEPFQCREGRVPGPTILSAGTGWVCEPVLLHFSR